MSRVPDSSGPQKHRRTRFGEDAPLPTKREACLTCRFWLPDQDPNNRNKEDPEVDFGYCRRRPPVYVEAMARLVIQPPSYGQHTDADLAMSVTAQHDASMFPATYFTEWCGDFEWLPTLEPMLP